VTATEVTLPPDPSSVRIARDRLRAAARELERSCLEVALLGLSELVSNAVLHAHGPLRVLVDVEDQWVRIEVHDPSHAEPTMRPFDPAAVHGRGLRIVGAVADRWGTAATEGGKVVWFEVDR
jgi:anti-sigma regulatory factor (Ser/Thr protein kinase)